MLGLTQKKQRRLKSNMFGMTIAELPAGLWIIFVGIAMPLMCLVLTTVRFALFWEATREAAAAACSAQAYATSTTTSQPGVTQMSAITLAQNTAVNVSSMMSGISINPDDVQCWIIITPLANAAAVGNPGNNNTSEASTTVGPNTPLNTSVDTTANLYQLRVDVTGQIQPVCSLSNTFFGNIPGLTQPFPVTISMTRVFENPQGLYQSNNGGN